MVEPGEPQAVVETKVSGDECPNLALRALELRIRQQEIISRTWGFGTPRSAFKDNAKRDSAPRLPTPQLFQSNNEATAHSTTDVGSAPDRVGQMNRHWSD